MAINDEFFQRLEKQLEINTTWPAVYMFKFIIPESNQGYALLRSLFGEESRLSTRHSANGKYISITVKEMMISPAEITERYRKAAEIEGIIAL
jgi:tRNA G37 N-methylase Trm5